MDRILVGEFEIDVFSFFCFQNVMGIANLENLGNKYGQYHPIVFLAILLMAAG